MRGSLANADSISRLQSIENAVFVMEVIEGKIYGSRTCKPNSVRRIAPAGRSFLWATHRCEALATYPKVLRTEPARAET